MNTLAALAAHVWYGTGALPAFARAMLTPAEWLYRTAMDRRNARFDLHAREQPARPLLPALSVGNLTVGGTGKTPVAAWCVKELRARGATPAVIMRGYGDDEWRVHTLLNPGVDVVVSADRRGALAAARSRGADCAVLDDAFQHRQAPRVADLVLVSVDQWAEPVRLLPAGPYREGLQSLQRASAIALTMKVPDNVRADAVAARLQSIAPGVPVVRLRFALHEVRLATEILSRSDAGDARRRGLAHDVHWLRGKRLVVATAIANAGAFEEQIRQCGAELVTRHRYRDHHRFSTADARTIAASASSLDGVVCTLKDAVKLAPVWPRAAPPLWYVSQTVTVDRGGEVLEQLFARILAARRTAVAFHAG